MPKNTTRQRLIESALRRFYRDGFRNVGIDQILTDVGISKTAFYKHFESKDELMLVSLEVQSEWLQETFRNLLREAGGPTPLGQLRAVLSVVEQLVASEDFQGCIFVNAAIEFPLAHDPVHRVAADNKAAIEELIHDLALQAGADDPRALARELCLVMEGTYVTRHVSGKLDTVSVARRVADLVIQSRCGMPDGVG